MKTSSEHEYEIRMTILTSKSKQEVDEEIKSNYNVECYKSFELEESERVEK